MSTFSLNVKHELQKGDNVNNECEPNGGLQPRHLRRDSYLQ